jgi:predicted permease
MMRRLYLKLVRRARLDSDLEAELAFHREMAATAGNAIPLGNAASLKEQALDLWRFNRVENLWRDLVFAGRTLRKSYTFVATALLSLALGIGVNATMFSLALEFLFRQPSVRDPQSVAYVRQGGNSHMRAEVIEALRRGGVFDDVAGENEETFINFDNGVETRPIYAVQATRNYFTALGVPIAQGRGWTESDPIEVAVLHSRFWRARLGGDPAIVGRTIRLDGRLYTVLGILPDNYRSLIGYGYSPDIFVPKYIKGMSIAAYARLKPGMTIGQANAAMPALTERIRREFPSDDTTGLDLNAARVTGFEHPQVGNEALTVALFFAALLVIVGLVLIIACVNVANLLLARGSARRQEIAIRAALGASRPRLLQQLFAESLLISLTGAALGFFLALVAAKAIAAIPLPFPVPIRLHIELDWRVAGYAALLAIVSAAATGILPAWQSVKESLSAGMHRERKLRMRRGLVVAQIAVSFVVLTTAALFLQNLARSHSLGPGFDIRRTLRAAIFLPPGQYQDGARVKLFVARALEELRTVPAIESAAAVRVVPFTDATTFGVDLKFPDNGQKQHAEFNWNAVTPEYFRVMDIPLVRGRTFDARDKGGPNVAIVNEEFVRRYLPGREPIGLTFLWGPDGKTQCEIVGVVRGTKNITIGENPRAQLYEPFNQVQYQRPRIQIVARSATPPVEQLAAVREAIRRAEPAAGIEAETMFSAIGFAFLPSQVGAALMTGIGALALVLALTGLYGVLAYSVARRTREIGIRMAVGASPRHVSRMVLGEFVWLLAVGIAIGLGIAVVVTRPLAMFFVPGLSPSDPASFGAVIAVLGGAGALAALGPVRRALGVDPLQSLRYE